LVLRQLENTQALKVIEDTAVTKEPEGLQRQKIVPSPRVLQEQMSPPDLVYHVLLVEVSCSCILISQVSVLTLVGQFDQPSDP
jgi:hypothetical protein